MVDLNLYETLSKPPNIFEEILLIKDRETANNFISKRKEEVEKCAKKKLLKMDFFFDPLVNGLFDETVSISPGTLEGKTFVMDDDEIYHKLIEYVHKIHDNGTEKDDDFLKILTSVQYAMNYYFGNISPISIEKWSEKFETPGIESYSIAHEKESAYCSERAAVAHNLLLFLGLNSRYTCGTYAESLNSGTEQHNSGELHGFLIVEYGGKEYLYDPTNPKILFDEKDQIISFRPYIIDNIQGNIDTGTKILGNFSHKKKEADGIPQDISSSSREYTIGR